VDWITAVWNFSVGAVLSQSGRGLTLTPHPLLVPWLWKGGAIPLLLLWAVRPLQSLSACTRLCFTFTFSCVTQTQGISGLREIL